MFDVDPVVKEIQVVSIYFRVVLGFIDVVVFWIKQP